MISLDFSNHVPDLRVPVLVLHLYQGLRVLLEVRAHELLPRNLVLVLEDRLVHRVLAVVKVWLLHGEETVHPAVHHGRERLGFLLVNSDLCREEYYLLFGLVGVVEHDGGGEAVLLAIAVLEDQALLDVALPHAQTVFFTCSILYFKEIVSPFIFLMLIAVYLLGSLVQKPRVLLGLQLVDGHSLGVGDLVADSRYLVLCFNELLDGFAVLAKQGDLVLGHLQVVLRHFFLQLYRLVLHLVQAHVLLLRLLACCPSRVLEGDILGFQVGEVQPVLRLFVFLRCLPLRVLLLSLVVPVEQVPVLVHYRFLSDLESLLSEVCLLLSLVPALLLSGLRHVECRLGD